MGSPFRIVIADDHVLIRRALTILLQSESDIDVAGVAANGEEALEMVKNLLPELVLLDVHMPRLDGLGAGRKILGCLPQTKLLMVSSDDTKPLIEESFRMGASGYLSKSCSLMDVPKAIRQIMEGHIYICVAAMRTLEHA